ncbi:hypothetical protein LBHB_08450 [Leptospira borgpetersenii serovar Hardjo]|nr:hypothetical protein LBHB_08450 [Leptospira borgpetersenii serovar Hardjo]
MTEKKRRRIYLPANLFRMKIHNSNYRFGIFYSNKKKASDHFEKKFKKTFIKPFRKLIEKVLSNPFLNPYRF